MTTFPGASVTEWMVDYGMNLDKAKGVRITADVTCLEVSPEVESLPEVFKPLLSGLLWQTKRPRIRDIAVVLVQGICDEVQVLGLESPKQFVHELDLRGIGAG